MFKIIQAKKTWFSISGFLVLASLLSLILWGFNPGIDFTGGSLLELKFNQNRPDSAQIEEALKDLNLASLYIQSTNQNGLLIRTISLTEDQHQQILVNIDKIGQIDQVEITPSESNNNLDIQGINLENLQIEALGENNQPISYETITAKKTFKSFEELRFDSIGPVIGQELQQKAIYAIIIVLLAIIAYIAYAFRKVSQPVESWKYGVSAIIALIHDIVIIGGVFSVLGHFFGVQIDAYFVTAILTILGFSVHDTIVTFDRTRENLHRHQDKTFEEVKDHQPGDVIISPTTMGNGVIPNGHTGICGKHGRLREHLKAIVPRFFGSSVRRFLPNHL